jgi:Yip1 domain
LSVSQVQMEARNTTLPSPVLSLFAPDLGIPRVARAGRLRWMLGFAICCSLLAGVATALRVDARDSTLHELESQGDFKTMSDKQIEDAQKGAERAFMVARIAWAAVEAPITLALDVAGLFLLSWFLRGKLKAGPLLAVCGAALLPFAFANLLEVIAALRQQGIAPGVFRHLVPHTGEDLAAAFGHPLSGPWAKLAGAFDLVGLWSALLLGFGLSAAAELPARKAVLATLAGWLLWRLFAHVGLAGG